MEWSKPVDERPLLLYVSYREFLNVEQFANLLRSIDEVYEAFYFVEVPNPSRPSRPLSTRLRLGRAETGNSVTVEFFQGITQIISSVPPELRGVAGGAVVLQLVSRILINHFRRGSLAWYEHKSRALALREASAVVELKERTAQTVVAAIEQVELIPRPTNVDQLTEAVAPALTLADQVISQPNIIKVQLAGETLKDVEASSAG